RIDGSYACTASTLVSGDLNEHLFGVCSNHRNPQSVYRGTVKWVISASRPSRLAQSPGMLNTIMPRVGYCSAISMTASSLALTEARRMPSSWTHGMCPTTNNVRTCSSVSLITDSAWAADAIYSRESKYGVGACSPSSLITHVVVWRVRNASEEIMASG